MLGTILTIFQISHTLPIEAWLIIWFIISCRKPFRLANWKTPLPHHKVSTLSLSLYTCTHVQMHTCPCVCFLSAANFGDQEWPVSAHSLSKHNVLLMQIYPLIPHLSTPKTSSNLYTLERSQNSLHYSLWQHEYGDWLSSPGAKTNPLELGGGGFGCLFFLFCTV